MGQKKCNDNIDWVSRAEKLQFYSVDELLKQQSYMQVAWLMERRLIAGDQVSDQHLLQLPMRYGQKSPYIMQALAKSLLHAGKLNEAKHAALLAVKGFAALYMPQPLLTSLALLGRIELRMGKFDIASVIVEQLRKEYEEKQEQKRGTAADLTAIAEAAGLTIADVSEGEAEVAHCLALGSLLLTKFALETGHEHMKSSHQHIHITDKITDKYIQSRAGDVSQHQKEIMEKQAEEEFVQAIMLFQIVISSYIQQEQWENACLAMIELAWHGGKHLEEQDWEWLYLQCMTAYTVKHELQPCEHMLKLIERYYKQHWWNMYLLAHDWIDRDAKTFHYKFFRKQSEDEDDWGSYWIKSMKLLLAFSCITGMQQTAFDQLAEIKLARKERATTTITAFRRRKQNVKTLQRMRADAKNAARRFQVIAEAYERDIKEWMKTYSFELPYQYELITSLIQWYRRIGKDPKELIQRQQILTGMLRVSNSKLVLASPAMQERDHSWKIHLFGRMRFSKGQDERMQLEWKRKKAKELFLFLALQPRYMAVREIVIEALQLGEQLERGAQQLYVIIHQLKRTLERELGMKQAVIIKDGIIKLREELIDYVDVERYLNLIRVADQLWQFDRDLSYEMYEQAYLLYDELLPELPYIEWLEQLREHLLQKQIQLLQKCVSHAEARADWQHAEIYLRSWITLQPYQEEAHAQLISSLIKQKRLNEAKSAYTAWEKYCQTELGTVPSFHPSFITSKAQKQ